MADPPQRSWPPVDENEGTEIDRDRVKKLIKALKDDLDRYFKTKGAAGTVDDIKNRAVPVQATDVGGAVGGNAKTSYPAGVLLFKSIHNVNTYYPEAYQGFLNSYKQVINALYSSAGFHDEAERNSTLPNKEGPPTGNDSGAYDNGQGQA